MKKLLMLAGFMLGSLCASADGMKDPSKWSFSIVSMKTPNTYLFSAKVVLDKGWHINALQPGGDGSFIPPSFAFNIDSSKLVGSLQEVGEMVNSLMDGVDGELHYYKDSVIYTQYVKVPKGSSISGTYTYQLCSDMLCLPPMTKPFAIKAP